MIERECKNCGIFYKAKTTRSERLCRPCANAKRNKTKRENYPKTKDQQLQFKYHISWDDYMSMMKAQDYKCAICSKDAEINSYNHPVLVVDHCHKSGRVRGLLCNSCNKAAGLLFDNTESVSGLLKYLHKHSENPSVVMPITISLNQSAKDFCIDYDNAFYKEKTNVKY
tara:strand:- start:21 stop:527 length:507 start_codon:yes stop_codon:yes gene_type:complete